MIYQLMIPKSLNYSQKTKEGQQISHYKTFGPSMNERTSRQTMMIKRQVKTAKPMI